MARLGKFFYINGTDNLSNAHFLRVRADGGITESLGCIDTAGTLLESASYFMRPSGFKEDTVYSLIPNNSNGSLNFVRGSDAWRTEIGGLVQRTPYNLLTFSEQFENSVWTKTRCAVTTNSITSPNGTITADTVVEDTTASASHPVSRAVTFNAGSQTFSVYAKAANRSWIHIALLSTANAFAYFDLSNGTVGTIGSATTASIQSIGDGWYRCIMSATTAAGSNTLGIYPASADANNVYTGNGTDSIYIWGSQLVEGVDPLPYFPTTDRLNVPRLSYMYGSCPALLLEPQRTNSLRNSSMTGASTSPSTIPTNWVITLGGVTATVVGLGSENGLPYIDIRFNGTATATSVNVNFESTTQITASNGQSWTSSFWIKEVSASAPPISYRNAITERDSVGSTLAGSNQTIAISSTLNRNAFTRTNTNASTARINNSLSMTLTVGSSYDFTVRIASPQMELGAYSTTWIPTTTASATRVADSFSRDNIYTNGLITSSGGTWFVELRGNVSYTRDAFSNGLRISDSSSTVNNGFEIRNGATIPLIITKRIAGVSTTLIGTVTSTTKIAIKWNGSTCDVFLNGVKEVAGSLFTTTNMEFLVGGAEDVPKFIQQMALYPTPLTDAQCQTLTTL